MNLTHELPNQLRLETHEFGNHYATCVCCTCGCKNCAVALEYESEAEATSEHEECVRAWEAATRARRGVH